MSEKFNGVLIRKGDKYVATISFGEHVPVNELMLENQDLFEKTNSSTKLLQILHAIILDSDKIELTNSINTIQEIT